MRTARIPPTLERLLLARWRPGAFGQQGQQCRGSSGRGRLRSGNGAYYEQHSNAVIIRPAAVRQLPARRFRETIGRLALVYPQAPLAVKCFRRRFGILTLARRGTATVGQTFGPRLSVRWTPAESAKPEVLSPADRRPAPQFASRLWWQSSDASTVVNGAGTVPPAAFLEVQHSATPWSPFPTGIQLAGPSGGAGTASCE